MDPNPLDTLQVLEKRIAAKEQTNLQAFQKQILLELKAIRDALVNESITAPAPNAPANQNNKRVQELQKENLRLNYRISHLTRNLKEALQKP